MARDGSLGPHAVNGHAGPSNAQVGAAAGAGASTSAGAQPPAKRVALQDRNVALLSLPSQDLPTYYDSPSSAESDGSDNETFPSSSRLGTTLVPLTNRGHKLSRSAPHVRRGKLGTHANVDSGFPDPLMSQAALVPPAQKRRKLNDLAPPHSSEGFPVAPNLHLVPRPLHTLSNDPDAPFPAYLPPAAQSPLDLLLSPAVQHTLGKKNATFLNLGMSTTGLIEQEAELVAALTNVCRGLRGEGFEWRWEGDEERRKKREEEKRVEEEERQRKAEEARAEREKERERKAQRKEDEEARAAAAAKAAADEEARQAEQAAAMEVDQSPVKIEQETPVLQAAPPVAAPANLVAVPGFSAPSSAPPAGDVEMGDAALFADSSSVNPPAAPAPSVETPSTLPSTAPGADVPAIAITPAGSAPSTAVPAAGASTVPPSPAVPPVAENGAAATPTPAAATDAAKAAPNGASLPSLPTGVAGTTPSPAVAQSTNGAASTVSGLPPTAGASTAVTPIPPVVETSDLLPAPSQEATPAPANDGTATGGSAHEGSEEPSRRRSGRVATRGVPGASVGAGGARHTRSRQSSPEEDYYSGEDDDDAGSSSEGAYAGERGGGAGTVRRGEYVPEDTLPEYAERLVDPETVVRSLFVTEESPVEMERMAQGPQGGLVGTGQMEQLTPNEQEVLLHDCLTDLHRFLADTLEYRNRLGEIRDGVLGVERRRKGMWKVVRTVAMDWLVEEGAGAGEGYEQ